MACQGPSAESAQESDASVIISARVVKYEFGSSTEKAKVTFRVIETIKGESKKSWVAVMRGATLPKSLQDFKSRFGEKVRVGLRFFSKKNYQQSFPKDYRDLPFIVDAACSMNGEDWLIQKSK